MRHDYIDKTWFSRISRKIGVMTLRFPEQGHYSFLKMSDRWTIVMQFFGKGQFNNRVVQYGPARTVS
jgi:hypothetical protein